MRRFGLLLLSMAPFRRQQKRHARFFWPQNRGRDVIWAWLWGCAAGVSHVKSVAVRCGSGPRGLRVPKTGIVGKLTYLPFQDMDADPSNIFLLHGVDQAAWLAAFLRDGSAADARRKGRAKVCRRSPRRQGRPGRRLCHDSTSTCHDPRQHWTGHIQVCPSCLHCSGH